MRIGKFRKKYRNNAVNILKIKKNKFYFNQIDRHNNDPLLMWKTSKKLVNSQNFNISFM